MERLQQQVSRMSEQLRALTEENVRLRADCAAIEPLKARVCSVSDSDCVAAWPCFLLVFWLLALCV